MKTRDLVLTALFAALTAIGAFIKIPVGTVPFSLQFFFTAMAGVLLGAKYGALSQAVYVLLGLIGLPVFTQGGGLGYLLYPTCGFLFGLIPAAWLIGKLTEKNSGTMRLIFACLAGLGVLYLVGLPYLYCIQNVYMEKGMSVFEVFKKGMLIFLPGDAIKIAVTAVISKPLRKALQR